MTATSTDWAAYMVPAARKLRGEPSFESRDELRFGGRGSLCVTLTGKKRGTWYDHEAAEGGGVLAFIKREMGYGGDREAVDWLRAELGADIPERGRGRRSTADYARELATRMKPIGGTPAEAYLTNTRGLTGPFPPDLGFHPRVRAKAGGSHPALLCVARDGGGAVQFVHAVFLDGDRKAGFSPAKQTFGKMEGAAVRIPASDPDAGARVVLAEGPEDALSWAQATGLESWACCGIANIGTAPVPKGAEVVVAAQNDSADEEAAKALHRAVRKLRGRGFRVVVAPPPNGVKDANDLLRAFGPEAVRDALTSAEERAGWRADLIYGERGGALPVLFNAVLALGQDDRWHGVLGYDEFACRVVMRRPAPWLIDRGRFAEREWTDLDDLRAAEWLQVRGILASHEIAGRAVQRVASDHPFHPLRAWLDGLKWDGTPRLDTWLTTYLGAADTAYTRAVAAKFPISAVARIYRPGCKVDTCPILEGPQGLRKSSALRALVGDAWFSDQMPDLGSKDSMVQMQGKWVVELAELDSLSRGEVSRVKAFMSTQTDRFRPPYGKRAQDFPRQCIFAGSTNLDDYLRDETGGRRFWPVRCGAWIDVAGIERDREQLWAEAVVRFRAGESWWLETSDLNKAAAIEQADRYQGDPWEEAVAVVVRAVTEPATNGVAIANVLSGLGLQTADFDQKAANRVARILRSLGWERRRKGPREAREYRYYPAVSQYDGPCPSMDGRTGTRKSPEKSGLYPSVPVSPTCSETFSGENQKKPDGGAGADFFGIRQEKGGEELGHTGTQGYGVESTGKKRVPLAEAHTGTPGNGADALDAALEQLRAMGFARAPAVPDGDGDDADAEERAAIEEIDGTAVEYEEIEF